jgi:RNA polymerase sigma-70 factor (ECF subfamily)
VELPEPTRFGEIVWLEPYPDTRLEQIADPAAGPEAHYERREAISLAFIAALQLLPPRPRATLILRDVLDFSARETAAILDTSTHTVNSALRRARTTLAEKLPDPEQPSPWPKTLEERELLDRLVRAWEDCDVPALVALMTEDVWLRMPSMQLEYQGRDQAARWFSTVVFRERRRFALLPTRANGEPAFGLYLHHSKPGPPRASGLAVVTLSRGRVSAITHFESRLLGRFGLQPTVPDQ